MVVAGAVGAELDLWCLFEHDSRDLKLLSKVAETMDIAAHGTNARAGRVCITAVVTPQDIAVRLTERGACTVFFLMKVRVCALLWSRQRVRTVGRSLGRVGAAFVDRLVLFQLLPALRRRANEWGGGDRDFPCDRRVGFASVVVDSYLFLCSYNEVGFEGVVVG